MRLEEKYQLIEVALDLSDSLDQTIRARERATGREVLIHMLSAGYGGDNDVLLRKIGRLPLHHRQVILDVGDRSGAPYFVTDGFLPGGVSLREWALAIPDFTAPVSHNPPEKVEPAPEPGPAPEPEVAPPPSQIAEPKQPGEFTRFLQFGAAADAHAPTPQPQAVAAPPPPAPPKPVAPTVEPDEFDKWIRHPSAKTERARPAHVAPPGFADIFESVIPEQSAVPELPTAPAAPPVRESGQFTKLFHSRTDHFDLAPPLPRSASPAKSPEPAADFPPPAGLSPSAESGDATGIFSRPRSPSSPAAVSGGGPGDFTRMFATPASIAAVEPAKVAAPEPAPVKSATSYLPLIIALSVLVIIAVGTLLFFLLSRP